MVLPSEQVGMPQLIETVQKLNERTAGKNGSGGRNASCSVGCDGYQAQRRGGAARATSRGEDAVEEGQAKGTTAPFMLI